MPINIMDGYKIKKVTTLKKLNKEMENIKASILEVYYREYHVELAELIGFILDMKAMGNSKEYIRSKLLKEYSVNIKEDICLEELIKFITRREFSSNNINFNHFNFSCKLSIYILDESVLLRIATAKPQLLKTLGYEDYDWVKHPGIFSDIVPWNYREEDDEPSTFKRKEWKERGSEWTYVLTRIKPFKMNLTSMVENYEKNLVLSIINGNFKKRCELIAEDIIDLEDERFKDLPKYKVQEQVRRAYTEIYVSLQHVYTLEDLNIIL